MANSAIKVEKNTLPQAILRELNKIDDDDNDSTNHKNEYLSADHEKYCKTGDMNYLTQPIISHSTWSAIPFKSIIFKNIYALDTKPQYNTKIDITNPMHHSFIEFNNYNGHFLVNNSLFNTIMYDTTWLIEQLNYVYKLSLYDTFTLKGYTYNGDVFANNYLRGTLDIKKLKKCNQEYIGQISQYFPMFVQTNKLFGVQHKQRTVFDSNEDRTVVQRMKLVHSNILKTSASIKEWVDILSTKTLKMSERYSILVPLWSYFTNEFREDVLKLFINDLIQIINQAPVNSKTMVVYRGVRNSFFLTNSTENIYKNIGFVSTSLDIDIAKEFQRPVAPSDDAKCCIQRVLLPKGTHSIILFPLSNFPDEKEILLPTGALYRLHKKKVLKSFYRHSENASTDLCFKNVVKVNVSDISVSNPQDNIVL